MQNRGLLATLLGQELVGLLEIGVDLTKIQSLLETLVLGVHLVQVNSSFLDSIGQLLSQIEGKVELGWFVGLGLVNIELSK